MTNHTVANNKRSMYVWSSLRWVTFDKPNYPYVRTYYHVTEASMTRAMRLTMLAEVEG